MAAPDGDFCFHVSLVGVVVGRLEQHLLVARSRARIEVSMARRRARRHFQKESRQGAVHLTSHQSTVKKCAKRSGASLPSLFVGGGQNLDQWHARPLAETIGRRRLARRFALVAIDGRRNDCLLCQIDVKCLGRASPRIGGRYHATIGIGSRPESLDWIVLGQSTGHFGRRTKTYGRGGRIGDAAVVATPRRTHQWIGFYLGRVLAQIVVQSGQGSRQDGVDHHSSAFFQYVSFL